MARRRSTSAEAAKAADDPFVFAMLRSWYYADAVATVTATWLLPPAIWFAIRQSVDGVRFVYWSVALAAVSALLLILRRSTADERRWRRGAFAHEFTVGTLWGSLMLITPPTDVVDQMFIAIVLCATCLASAGAMGQFPSLFLAFAIPTMAVGLLGFWIHAPELRLKMALLFVVTTGFSYSVAAQGSQHSRRLARTLQRNEYLADDLAGRNDALHDANTRLDLLARTDSLTGLHNRRSFDLILEAEMQALVDGSRDQLSLAYLDLDRFKAVNDQYGHRVGDKLLQIFAARLRSASQAGEHVARIGGDELVLLSSASASQELGERLVERLVAPMAVDGMRVDVGVSIGVASTRAPVEPDVLLRRSDIALYDAKAAGGERFSVAEDPLDDPVHVR